MLSTAGTRCKIGLVLLSNRVAYHSLFEKFYCTFQFCACSFVWWLLIFLSRLGLKCTVLGARKHQCCNPDVNQIPFDSVQSLVCRRMVSAKTCEWWLILSYCFTVQTTFSTAYLCFWVWELHCSLAFGYSWWMYPLVLFVSEWIAALREHSILS